MPLSFAQRASYEAALEDLLTLLRASPHTAQQAAEALGCGRVTAYERLVALERRGVRFARLRVRVGDRGPHSVAYSIPGNGVVAERNVNGAR